MTFTVQNTQFGTNVRHGNSFIQTSTDDEATEMMRDPDFEEIFRKEREKYEC